MKVSAVVGVAMVAATVGRLSGVGEAARGVGSLCAVGLEKIRAVGSQGPESVQALRWSRQRSAVLIERKEGVDFLILNFLMIFYAVLGSFNFL